MDFKLSNVLVVSDDNNNDAVFYVTVNPPEAQSTVDLQPVDVPTDSDGDLISDLFDDYPDDPNKAFDNYFPGENEYGTLAFEDNWPYEGDYDFNDLVTDYNYHFITNVAGNVVEMNAKFTIRAVGAGYKNGFGFEIPITTDKIASVTGSVLTEDHIPMNINGTESGNYYSVIMVTDKLLNVISSPTGGFVNTYPGDVYIEPVDVTINIVFTNPISQGDLGAPPYNPFIFVNQERGREVHLAGKTPTDHASFVYFGQGIDNTNFNNSYYKSDTNKPWALNFPDKWDYMSERQHLSYGYLRFLDWVGTSGSNFSNWYLATEGNRNEALVYSKPQ